MKQTLYALAVSVSLLGLTTACSQSSSSDPAPSYKPHKFTFTYINSGLETAKSASGARVNLGTGFRAFVDGKPLMLGGVVDTTYYISAPNTTTPITFPDTYTIAGKELRIEVGFYNIKGTSARPLTLSGQTLTMPNARVLLLPIFDGVVPNAPGAPSVVLGSYGQTPVMSYDNGKNPTAILTVDLTKL